MSEIRGAVPSAVPARGLDPSSSPAPAGGPGKSAPTPDATPSSTFSAGAAAAPAPRPEVSGHAFFPLSEKTVDQVRTSGDPRKIAGALHTLFTDRSNLLLGNDGTRVDRTRRLLDGMSPEGLEQVRAAYVHKYGCDPEINIKSADFGEPVARLSHDTQLELMDALNGPQMKQAAQTIASLQSKADAGTLTAADRKELYSLLPMTGLWNAPVRAGPGENLDSMERTLLKRAWSGTGAQGSLDSAIQQIQSKLPEPDLSAKAPREKSIAVIASSHGAQWQELMDWASEMHDKGYNLQVFTPDGQPVSFQRDSLNVSTRTVNLGYGAPAHLDPHGGTGELAKELLGNAAPSSKFDPKQFGAVYLAGGLGFNEDVAVAETSTKLTANPNIAGMMQKALGEKLPIVALCHGPTLLAATPITMPDGHTEPLNKGVPTASLPPFESYVQLSGRKEAQFTLDVNTHHALAETGGQTDVLRDIANMSRVVKGNKAGIDIITGPGPQASRNLADPTVEAMQRRWGK
ncbi:MAG TPA: hypothetical protein VND93_07465 [Myxococcales bacterium]|nr:hypothetical protein [Myxococcales bacterium]